MPFLPFLQMTPTSPRAVRPGIDVDENGYALPKNALPLPPPVAPIQNTNNLDSNLIAQLEAAKYGQTLPPQSTPTLEAPAQVPTQPQLNMQAQQSGGLLTNVPPSPSQAPKLTPEDELALAYGQQQELQNQAIKQAEEQLAAARSRPQQMDLSPLIALADAWSQRPMNLLSAYKRPEDQAKVVQALQEAVLKARGGASELARMRAKDVRQLGLQEEQMRINEELKRAQIAAMGQQKEGKQDLSIKKFQRESEKEYTETYGEPLRNLAIFGSKVSQLEKTLSSKGDPFFGVTTAEIESLSSSINTDYNRDIGKLGALAGGDLELIKAATGQGLGVKEYVTRMMRGGVQGRIALLNMLKADVSKRAQAYKNEVMSNSDYEFVANRLDNDLIGIDKAVGTNLSGTMKQKEVVPDQINKMSREELLEAARVKRASEANK